MSPISDAVIAMESEVRGYSRSWPAVFDRAVGSHIYDEDGREYIDFFAGAGALNYGHNNPTLKKILIDYISDDRVMHSLDMFTTARQEFIQTFNDVILTPRGLDYTLAFPGPGGTQATEAALKLARKYTGRETVISFTNGFHGMTLGALAVTGNSLKRSGAGIPLSHATPMPYDNYCDDYSDFGYLERLLTDSGSGLDKPAAVIVETVQGEGGINPARYEWLQNLEKLCKKHEILLIIDDVQMGCGRTGTFFSFEEAGIEPDMVCLSKSISGYGIPMALTLLKPELDVWEPGEHNGTFRGISAGFATATATIREYWSDDAFTQSIQAKAETVAQRFQSFVEMTPGLTIAAKGRGLARGIEMASGELADAVCEEAFTNGLLVETAGSEGEVVKLLAALTIPEDVLETGLDILESAIATVASRELADSASTIPAAEETNA
ncbi:MAG: diaminobutyrate--2-oxoglutarate transaminase [Canibacter sp.]